MIRVANEKIESIIKESDIDKKDKEFIGVHLKTVYDYIHGMEARHKASKLVFDLADSKSKEITEKCILLNTLLNAFYHKLTGEEILTLKDEIAKCQKSSGIDLTPK